MNSQDQLEAFNFFNCATGGFQNVICLSRQGNAASSSEFTNSSYLNTCNRSLSFGHSSNGTRTVDETSVNQVVTNTNNIYQQCPSNLYPSPSKGYMVYDWSLNGVEVIQSCICDRTSDLMCTAAQCDKLTPATSMIDFGRSTCDTQRDFVYAERYRSSDSSVGRVSLNTPQIKFHEGSPRDNTGFVVPLTRDELFPSSPIPRPARYSDKGTNAQGCRTFILYGEKRQEINEANNSPTTNPLRQEPARLIACDTPPSAYQVDPTLKLKPIDQPRSDSSARGIQNACEICGKTGFANIGNLRRHIRSHSGLKPYKCDQCQKSFTEGKSLKIHVRIHSGDRPFRCSLCSKSFSQSIVLQSHLARHTGQRKYQCSKCEKSFRQKNQLTLHLKRHEGVKSFECSKCSAKFSAKGDLDRHFIIHTGEKPFKCHLCSKRFARVQYLTEHINRHNGLKPYECLLCAEKFTDLSGHHKHKKMHLCNPMKPTPLSQNVDNAVNSKTVRLDKLISW